MKKIVIHAGLPKTGSTFLQENVFSSIPANVCAYNPKNLQRLLVRMCKQVVGRGALEPDEIASLKKQVDEEINRQEADILLISIEGLLPLHSGGASTGNNIFKVLKALIDDALIVIFIREQSAWLRSAYSFYLVSGYIFPFEEYVNKTADGCFKQREPGQVAINVQDYDNQAIKDIARQHYPNVLCFRFEDLFSGKQEAVLSRLTSAIGLAPLKPRASQAVNKGLDERLMVIASKVIGYVPFRGPWQLAYLYPRYSALTPLELIRCSYLRSSGLVALAIARLLYKYTPYAKDARLFSPQDEAHIKGFYLEKNNTFWAANS